MNPIKWVIYLISWLHQEYQDYKWRMSAEHVSISWLDENVIRKKNGSTT